MAKKKYTSVWMDTLNTEDDPVIVISGSQGTSGYDSMFSFDGISEADLVLIDAYCDDIDLADMDTNHDYVITQAEFQAWYDANEPW